MISTKKYYTIKKCLKTLLIEINAKAIFNETMKLIDYVQEC